MSVTNAAVEQMRSLLNSGHLNEQQVAKLMELGRLCGPKPSPSGYRNGEPYWTSQSIIEWSENAKRSRADATPLTTRSAVAGSASALMKSLFARQRDRDHQDIESIDAIALAVANGEGTPDDIDARLEASGHTVNDLGPILQSIEVRRSIIGKQRETEAAKREVAELTDQIAVIEGEAQKKLKPLREKSARLQQQREVAERRSRGDLRATNKLTDSAPAWLREEHASVTQEIHAAQQESDSLSKQLTSNDRALEECEAALPGILKKTQLLAGAVAGDYEAKERRRALAEQETQHRLRASSLKDTKADIERRTKENRNRLSDLRARSAKIDELMQTQVWPQPSALDG